MWPIIYRILYPYIFCFVLMSIFAAVSFHGYYKVKNKKKRDKSKKTHGIIWSVIAAFSLIFAMYCSFDLILKDFVTRYGTYEYSNRDKDLLILWFSVSDGQDSCHTFLKNGKNIEEGT